MPQPILAFSGDVHRSCSSRGSVSTTVAFPDESVVTMRLDRRIPRWW